MNLCLSILPTTLLATLPVGDRPVSDRRPGPGRLALCLMLVLGIVSPLVQAAAFLNSMKSMEFAVRDTRHLLDLEELPEASEPARLSGSGITLRDVSFSYSGKEEDTVLRHIDLELPAGTFTALVVPPVAANLRQPAYRPVLGCDGWLHCHRRCGYSESHTEAAGGSGQFRDTGQFPL